MAEYIEREAARQAHIKASLTTRLIDAIPAADVVEVRHGRWIEPDYLYYGAKQYVCDQCKDDEFWEERIVNYKDNFCPNCGADMREAEAQRETILAQNPAKDADLSESDAKLLSEALHRHRERNKEAAHEVSEP